MLRPVLAFAMLLLAPAQPPADLAADDQRRYHDLAQQGQPAEGDNAFELVGPVADRIKAITAEVVAARFPGEQPEWVDLQALTRRESTPREREIAREVLTVLLASDVPRLAAKLAAAPRSIRPPETGLLIQTRLPETGRAGAVARFQAGRLALAQERGDDVEWLTAFEETIQLGRQVAHEPMLIANLAGVAVQTLAVDAASRRIAAGCDDAMLARIARALAQRPLPDISFAFRGEAFMASDAMEFVYDTGPAGMRFLQTMGTESKLPPRPAAPAVPEGQAMGPGLPAREEHLRMIAEYYAALIDYAALPQAQRSSAVELRAAMDTARSASLILDLVTPALDKAIAASDQLRAQRAGLFTVIALERFRLTQGTYPEQLADLPGELLGEPAIDPYTAGPLGYLPPSRGPYHGRAYLLYAAGADGKDDGGKVNFEDPCWVNRTGGTGDLLLNMHAPAGK